MPTYPRCQHTCNLKDDSHLYPIDFRLQAGGKQVNPDELTQVSDSGERAKPTHLQFESWLTLIPYRFQIAGRRQASESR
ncbi:hypothetical protein DA391_00645 [Yersinia massiliensis]|uniref:Uncharacterized protein n=1 Tax=Yersinia massiliensis TaxID=419257 RepID=A0ABM6UN73_9GAMM|nr:hypothetical protein DA391_00645 [Yersinia massiliensis]